LDVLITNQQAAIKHIDAVDATDQLIPEIGIDEKSDIIKGIREKVHDCLNNGMPTQYEKKLLGLLIRRKDAFRRKLGSDEPAQVTPFETNLMDYRYKARHYSDEQSEFLWEFLRILYRNLTCL
jgi:hypothetical protein